jgi:hypothetical protein
MPILVQKGRRYPVVGKSTDLCVLLLDKSWYIPKYVTLRLDIEIGDSEEKYYLICTKQIDLMIIVAFVCP